VENTIKPELLAEELRTAFQTDEAMTTQPKTRNYSKRAHNEAAGGQIAPSLSQGRFDVAVAFTL
jgi:hypothetical protein